MVTLKPCVRDYARGDRVPRPHWCTSRKTRRTKNILNQTNAARALTRARASAPIAGRDRNSENHQTQKLENTENGEKGENTFTGDNPPGSTQGQHLGIKIGPETGRENISSATTTNMRRIANKNQTSVDKYTILYYTILYYCILYSTMSIVDRADKV